jgi:hypothetical protein
MKLEKPTLKAIHICNSHQPTLKPKIAKEYVFANADKLERRRSTCGNITYTQAGVSCFVGQVSDKFKVQFFVGNSVVKIPACV